MNNPNPPAPNAMTVLAAIIIGGISKVFSAPECQKALQVHMENKMKGVLDQMVDLRSVRSKGLENLSGVMDSFVRHHLSAIGNNEVLLNAWENRNMDETFGEIRKLTQPINTLPLSTAREEYLHGYKDTAAQMWQEGVEARDRLDLIGEEIDSLAQDAESLVDDTSDKMSQYIRDLETSTEEIQKEAQAFLEEYHSNASVLFPAEEGVTELVNWCEAITNATLTEDFPCTQLGEYADSRNPTEQQRSEIGNFLEALFAGDPDAVTSAFVAPPMHGAFFPPTGGGSNE